MNNIIKISETSEKIKNEIAIIPFNPTGDNDRIRQLEREIYPESIRLSTEDYQDEIVDGIESGEAFAYIIQENREDIGYLLLTKQDSEFMTNLDELDNNEDHYKDEKAYKKVQKEILANAKTDQCLYIYDFAIKEEYRGLKAFNKVLELIVNKMKEDNLPLELHARQSTSGRFITNEALLGRICKTYGIKVECILEKDIHCGFTKEDKPDEFESYYLTRLTLDEK